MRDVCAILLNTPFNINGHLCILDVCLESRRHRLFFLCDCCCELALLNVVKTTKLFHADLELTAPLYFGQLPEEGNVWGCHDATEDALKAGELPWSLVTGSHTVWPPPWKCWRETGRSSACSPLFADHANPVPGVSWEPRHIVGTLCIALESGHH